MTSFEDLLRRDGVLVYKTRGTSMLPMLKENRDLVTVAPLKEPPKKGDVILFRQGPVYVLHRVIKAGAGSYITRGDHNFVTETVRESDVLGVLTGFKRKGKEYSVLHPGYRLYSALWPALCPLRHLGARIRRRLRRILKSAGLLPLARKLLRKK